jgi:hypothetical protein
VSFATHRIAAIADGPHERGFGLRRLGDDETAHLFWITVKPAGGVCVGRTYDAPTWRSFGTLDEAAREATALALSLLGGP